MRIQAANSGNIVLTNSVPIALKKGREYVFTGDMLVRGSYNVPSVQVALSDSKGRVLLIGGGIDDGRFELIWRGQMPRDGNYTLSITLFRPDPQPTIWIDNVKLRPAIPNTPLMQFSGNRVKGKPNSLNIWGRPNSFAVLLLSGSGFAKSPFRVAPCGGYWMLQAPVFVIFSTVRIPTSGNVATLMQIPAAVGGQALYWQAVDVGVSASKLGCGFSCPTRYGFF